MKGKTSFWVTVLFFGALWGLLEATLGYALQFLPPLVSGSVMFPIAATLLWMAYQKEPRKRTLLYVTIVAASLKAVNFVFPFLPAIKTYNPMIAMFLQSFLVMAVIPLIQSKPIAVKASGFFVASVGWRVLFLGNISFNHALTSFPFQQLASVQTIIYFTLIMGTLGALVWFLLDIVLSNVMSYINVKVMIRPVIAGTLYALALLATFFLSEGFLGS